MRRSLLVVLGAVVICLGCEKKESTEGQQKERPPRLLEPGQQGGVPAPRQ
jgi:hypothetical protein